MKSISIKPVSLPNNNLIGVIAICLVFGLFVWGVYTYLPVHVDANPPDTWGFSVDWKRCFRPITFDLLAGRSPYTNGCGMNPPWAYLLLVPIALLQPALGAAVMFTLTYLVYVFAFLRMGAKPFQVIGLCLCPFVFINALNGNIDFLPVLGMVLPPQIGLFFVMMKPQLGIGIAVFWLYEAWREGGIREMVRVFSPVTLAFLLSFALYGLWPLMFIHMSGNEFNASVWPLALPLGLGLLIYALRSRNKLLAISATPFLAPYINIHSYAILLFAFIPYEPLLYIVLGLSWIAIR